MPPAKTPVEIRFWRLVRKQPGCWIPKNPRKGKTKGWYWSFEGMSGHRFSWMLHNGPIPDGLCVLHSCDNPMCVKPSHLFLGTYQDNTEDMIQKGRTNPLKGNVVGIAAFSRDDPTITQGEFNGNSKLLAEDIVTIRQSFKRYGPRQSNLRELATQYGVTPELISQIVRRVRWPHV